MAQLPAYAVDQSLPDTAFGVWLRAEIYARLPKEALDDVRFGPCADAPDECMMFVVDIPSRARRLELRFDRRRFTFIEGVLGGPEMELMPPITSLAELPNYLARPMRPYPLACSEGMRLQLEEEHAGLREWCETPEGVKHGPARAWFSAGRYLMHRGTWRHGAKSGVWLECDRFERCRRTDYRSSPSSPPLR